MTDPALLILTGEWPAPSETFILRDLQALRAAGFPFVLAAVRGQVGIEMGGIAAELILTDEAGGGSENHMSRASGAADWVKTAGRKWRHRDAVAALRRFCMGSGVRHLHAAHLDLPGYLVGEVARSLNLSFSLEGHARDVYCSNFSLAQLCRGASFVAVCNEAARAYLADRMDEPKPMLIHHVGPELGPEARPENRSDTIRILFVGRLVPKKGVLSVLAIADLVAASTGRLVACTIVGNGPQADAARVAARNVSPQVSCEFTGWLAHSAVLDLMRDRFDLLLLPAVVASDGDQDGIPNVILEAMAIGLPVMATQVGGIGEVLCPETGWPIVADQLESAAQAVSSLVSDSEAAAVRTNQAARLVQEQFAPAVTVETRIGLWRSLLS